MSNHTVYGDINDSTIYGGEDSDTYYGPEGAPFGECEYITKT